MLLALGGIVMYLASLSLSYCWIMTSNYGGNDCFYYYCSLGLGLFLGAIPN